VSYTIVVNVRVSAPKHDLLCNTLSVSDCWHIQLLRLCVKKAEMSKQKIDPLSQRNSSFATSREVWKYITDSGITTVS